MSRLRCLLGGHDEQAAVSRRAPLVLVLCRRCGRRRSLPLVGPPRQASVAEAVEWIRAAGVVLIDQSTLDELRTAYEIERAMAPLDWLWES